MSKNYAKGIPMGDNQVPFFESPPPVKAIVATMSENATASSIFALSDNTTAVEIATQGTAAVIRWFSNNDYQTSVGNRSVIAIAGSTANYDHIIPSNAVKRFIVPIEIQKSVGANASFMGARVENGLYTYLAWKTQGIASVFLTEYGSSNSF